VMVLPTGIVGSVRLLWAHARRRLSK